MFRMSSGRQHWPAVSRIGKSEGCPALSPMTTFCDKSDDQQRYDDDCAQQGVRHCPRDQITNQSANRQDRVPGIRQDPTSRDAQMSQEEANQQTKYEYPDYAPDYRAHCAKFAAVVDLVRSHSSLTRGSASLASSRVRSASNDAVGASRE